MDTNGAEESVIFSEVSSHARVVLGVGKLSFLERCPRFRCVLIEGFCCCCVCVLVFQCSDPPRRCSVQ